MKFNPLVAILIIPLALIALVLYSYPANISVPPKNAGGLIDLPVDQTNAATNTLSWISTTATSTLVLHSFGADLIDLNVNFVASSTASCLNWVYEFSNNANFFNATSTGDWFGETGKTNSSNILVTHGAGALNHLWCPGSQANATSSRNFSITPVAERFTRIKFSAVDANAGIWAQAIMRKQAN